MSILFISNSAEVCPIVHAMQKEGTDVQLYIHHPAFERGYDGILPKVKLGDLPRAVRKASLVIIDHVRPNMNTKRDAAILRAFNCDPKSKTVFGPVAGKICKRKVPVIGSTTWTEQLELDRRFGSTVAQKLGLSIPVTYDFDRLSEAQKFLESKRSLWVLKPHNNMDLDLTYVETYPGELEYMLREVLPQRIGTDKCQIMLQKYIPGTAVSTEGWFDGQAFTHFNHTFEDKSLMCGNLGPHIGSQSNTVWTRHQIPEITRALMRLQPLLQEAGYVGPIDVNCLVAEKNQKPYFLEFTPRFGYDAIFCLLEMLPGKVTEFFENRFQLQPDPRLFACSQRVSIPPFPYGDDAPELMERAKNAQIKEPLGKDGVWWQDVLWENGGLQCAGSDGIICITVGKGYSIGEAANSCLQKAKELKIGGYKQYRTDHKERAMRAYEQLPVR